MITEKTRIQEWLRRVANEVSEIKTTNMTKDDALKIIKDNYGILSVLTMVATGNAYMVGIPPINQKTNK